MIPAILIAAGFVAFVAFMYFIVGDGPTSFRVLKFEASPYAYRILTSRWGRKESWIVAKTNYSYVMSWKREWPNPCEAPYPHYQNLHAILVAELLARTFDEPEESKPAPVITLVREKTK